jgi:putative DNA primase/helicase
MLLSISDFFKSGWRPRGRRMKSSPQLVPLGVNDFLSLRVLPRKSLLNPIIPERSLSMLYAPRGIGKSWLGLSIGLAVATGSSLLRWSAPEPRRVLYVDGEMPLVSLQERIRAIANGMNAQIANKHFMVLAADNCENGIDIGTSEGQKLLDPVLSNVDLLVLDNLSTLCSRSETASDAWTSIQGWLLSLRRRGVAVLMIHHAGVNGRQRGTSRREDALDTVIGLRRPDELAQHGARFEVHYEKLRNRVEGGEAASFEAEIEDQDGSINWVARDLAAPPVQRAADLFAKGRSIRSVAAMLRISKSEAGRLRKDAVQDGLLVPEADEDPIRAALS